MFKAYTLSLRKTLEASLPGVRGTHQPKARKATADKGTEQLEKSKHEERKGDVGVDKGNLERTSEEHWALVAGQVFKSWTGDCPRRTYQSSLASALTLRPADVSEGSAGPWNGHLPQAELLKLTQLADELGLGKDARQLAWWLVGSRLASVDAEWILSHVKDIQASLGKNAYTEEEKADLLHSLTLYIYSQIKRLKSLHSAFPSSSSKQLTFTLRTLRSLEEHPATRRLLDTAGQPPIPEDVTAALQRHVHEWWSEVIQMKPSSAEEREGQLRQAVNTVTRVPALLLQESEMYHHIFQRELSVSYDNLCRREVRNRLDHLSSSLLVPSESKPQAPLKDRPRDGEIYSQLQNFAVGSPLWSLYKSLGRAYSACDNLESKTAAAPHSYPGCFLRSVAFWLGPASRDARLVIFDSCSSTSTLQDVLTSFTEAREWWRELAWPDPETRGVVAVGLLENLCSLATRRCQGVISRCPRDSTPPVQPYFDIEFCSCLKSVSRVAEEVQQLSDDLGLEEVVEEMRKCGNRGAADQAKDTVSTLLSSVGQNLENLLDQYIDTAIDQAVPKLREEVVEVCERGNSSTPPSLPSTLSLLQEHLPHSLSPRSHYVPPSSSKASSTSSSPCLSVCSSPSLFQRLLVRLWDAVVLQFMVTVAEKTGKQTSEYFSRVHSILEASLALFTSTGRLHPRAAATPGYRSVAEQVKGQRMSSPALILQYYLSRYTQQTEPHLPTVAHVLVRAFFSQPGHLTVRVLEVRDVEAVTGKSLRYHVTVQVVPREVCCGGFLHRTTTVTHCPASFYETFEFPTGECRGEGSAGWLQFTLEAARGSSGSGLFLGEAFVPLASIPYVDSPELQNTTLRLTTPVFQPGYESVTALRSRVSNDEQAASFIRMLERRHPESRGTGPTKCSRGAPLQFSN